MIFGHIANTAPEQYPTPVANAVAYLQRTDFSVLPAGRYEDPATGYVVQVLDLHTQPPDALRPECIGKTSTCSFWSAAPSLSA